MKLSKAGLLGILNSSRGLAAIVVVVALAITSAAAAITFSEMNASDLAGESGPTILNLIPDREWAYVDETVVWSAMTYIHTRGDGEGGLLFTWDWGDGNCTVDYTEYSVGSTIVGDDETHAWTQPGTYDVKVSVWDGYSNEWSTVHNVSTTATFTVLAIPVDLPPEAEFSVSPDEGTVDTVFTFDASASSDAEDPTESLVVRWDWESDGYWDTDYSTSKIIEHQFAAPGVYNVILQVKDTSGATDMTFKGVYVSDAEVTTLHDPIYIDGDSEFAAVASAEGWAGTGTEADPYVIELYEIPGGDSEAAVSVLHTTVHFVVRDCLFPDAYPTAVYMLDADHASVEGNHFTSCSFYSIYFEECSGISITDNTVEGGTHCIGVIRSDQAYVANNTVQWADWWSIWLESSTDVTLRENAFDRRGIEVGGSQIAYWNSHDIDDSNTVDGKPVYYYKDRTSGGVPAEAGQVILANCTGMTVTTDASGGIRLGFSAWNWIVMSSVSFTHTGIALSFSPNNTIELTTVDYCTYGMDIRNSPDCTITNTQVCGGSYGMWIQQSDRPYLFNNTVTAVEWYGVFLYYSSFAEVRQNTIAWGAQQGLMLVCSGSNLIVSNNFIGNPVQAEEGVESYGSLWDEGYPLGGNYWSDYQGVDLLSGVDQTEPGPDGIGDTPYVLASGSQDNYPLMEPSVPDADDTAPVADFSVYPDSGTTATTFEFDASASSDLEDPGLVLVRWDWETDGIWDTEWTLDRLAYHQFAEAGTYAVTLEVIDSGGLTDTASASVVVSEPSGDLDPNTIILQFNATDAVFDPGRPYVYITDKYAHTLHIVNLATGMPEKTFSFPYMTESLAITPDGSRLYVALLTREHSSYWWDEDGHIGYIASIDLETQVKDLEYVINEDPGDILVTGDGRLIVGSGSGQWTYIRVYDASDGTLLSSDWQFRQMSRLALHPSESMVYSADVDISPSDIHRHDLRTNGEIYYAGDSPYHGDYRMDGNVWVSPLGDELVTRGGDVFVAGQPIESDMTFITSMSPVGSYIETAFYDPATMVVFTGEGCSMRYYSMENHLPLGGVETSLPVAFVAVCDDLVGMVLRGVGTTEVRLVDHPYPGGVDNEYPEPALTATPPTGTTLTDFVFDASASTDDHDPLSELQFRWDFDGDGVWDTGYSSEPVIVNRYDMAGTFGARVEVTDTLGWSAVAVVTVEVALEADPGDPGPAHDPFVLPYPVTDAAFDPVRPYMYVSSKYENRVYFVNLETGLTEKQFEFDLMTESLTITPDGSRLYAALLTREHDPYWFAGRVGQIACFDLSLGVKDGQYEINEDPFDIVATSGGLLVVSSGSGQWTYIKVYDGADGTEVGSASIRQMCRISLHPAETMVYATTTDVSPSDIERYDISLTGAIAVAGDSPYHGEYEMAGDVWVNPLGDSLVVRGGHVFTAGMPIGEDMYYLTTMTSSVVTSVAFDVADGAVFSIEDSMLRWYDIDTYAYIGSASTTAAMEFVGIGAGSVYCLDVQTAMTQISVIDNPLA